MKKLFLLALTITIFSATQNVAMAKTTKNKKSTNSNFELNVAHINDHHSHLEEEKMPLKLGDQTVTVNIGGMARMAQAIDDFRKENKNTLVLHAGDAQTGTLYFTLFEGKADANIMNEIKFDAFTLGNHEFDAGNKGLKGFLDVLKVPVVSANVVPDKGSILENKWKPYIIKNINGEKVAIIGIEVVKKTKESSSPGDDIKFYDEVETAKKYVKEVQDKGINKIILLSHAGYERNLEIAKKVEGIDLIVSGDTHYLLGSQFEQFGLKVADPDYPKKIDHANGEPTYVVEAWCYAYLLGQLKLDFNQKGVVTNVVANPQLLIGDNFFEVKDKDNKNVQLTGAEKDKVIKFVNENKNIKFVKNEPQAEELLEGYKKEKNEMGKKSVGKILDKIPGGSENRIPDAKNPEGSLATTLVMESVLDKLKTIGTRNIDFVIGNAGNIRITLEPGEFNYDLAYTLLPFATNTIYTLEIKGSEVKQVLEDAIDYSLTGGSTGSFPYGAGIRYEATKAGKLGTRVKKIEVLDRKSNEWVPIDSNKTYVMGTNSYIASGKDGYKTLGEIIKTRGGTNTYLSDVPIFIDYVKAKKEISRPKSSNVIFKY